MGIEIEFAAGQTPLDDDEIEGLLISSIAVRSQLDEFEQQNIEHAMEWTLRKKFSAAEIFTEEFVRLLHRKMYNEVWKWAGEFRQTEKNIGVDPFRIGIQLRQLNEDALFWISNRTYVPDEIAIRYKHRLVSIHCFANGNGRHSRLMADVIADKIFELPVFSWGKLKHVKTGEARNAYLKSLKDADNNDFNKLIEFARS
jgi:Fic-DOC domain mobile mystery protein B